MNRRTFLRQSGALVVAFSTVRIADELGLAPQILDAQRLNGAGNPQLDGWVQIHADGTVTAFTGKCELGHGLYTAQTQLVAEELCVPFDRVRLVQCDTALTPDQGTTSGAQSHPTNFNRGGLALACATAREALVGMAATHLGVTADQVTVRDGIVQARGKSITYGELIGDRRFNLELDPSAKRKPSSDWTVLGRPIRRIEIPAIVTGRFEYVQNVRIPGMRHGRVVRPPTHDATVARVDEASVSALPGNVRVIRPEELRRGRRGRAVAGGAGCPHAARDLDAWARAAAAGHAPRPAARRVAAARHAPRRRRRRRGGVQRRREDRERVLQVPVPDACVDGDRVRRGGRAEGQGNDLVGDAGGLSAAEQRRDAARPRA